MGVLEIRALLLVVCVRAHDFGSSQTMAQYPKPESIGSTGSIVLSLLEVLVGYTEGHRVPYIMHVKHPRHL